MQKAEALSGGFAEAPVEGARAFRAVMQALARPGRIERLWNVDGVEGFDLVQQEAPVAVRARQQRLTRSRIERQGPFHQPFGAVQQLLQRSGVQPAQDQHLRA